MLYKSNITINSKVKPHMHGQPQLEDGGRGQGWHEYTLALSTPPPQTKTFLYVSMMGEEEVIFTTFYFFTGVFLSMCEGL